MEYAPRMRVLLLTNPLKRSRQLGSWREGRGMDSFNYGMACIAAVVEQAGYDVECLDLFHRDLSADELEQHAARGRYDVVGITFFTPQTDLAQKTAAVVRRALPDCRIVFGGIHVTSVPDETLRATPDVDVCVVGEGDFAFTELLDCWRDGRDIGTVAGIVYRRDGEITFSKPRDAIRDLDVLPMPAYHLFPMREYTTSPNVTYRHPTISFQVTRGCPFKCNFCEYLTVGGSKIRHKSVPRIIDEIRHLRDHFGYRGIVFRDSTLTVKRTFMVELCEAMIEHRIDMPWMCYSRTDCKRPRELFQLMKRAGCWQVGFGCESGNQKSLDLLDKGTTVEQNRDTIRIAYEEGLSISTTWMIALPGETTADAQNTIDFALSLPTHIAKFFLPVPYPRTGLAEHCKQDGGLRDDLGYEFYDMFDQDNPVYVNPRIGKEQSIKLLKSAYRRYYTSPKMWMRNAKQLRDVSMMRRYYDGVRLMLSA